MEQIIKIYDNDIGIAFKWAHIDNDITQIIFRDTGFHLTENEIELFIDKITDAKMQEKCETCLRGNNCKSILLQTPSNKVSMAVSLVELGQIDDLLKGTLFQIRMNDYLNELCKN